MKAVYILWDASQIWGLLAVRAVEALGLPHALARASDIAEGLLQRAPAPLLLVPGGSARQKAAALGEAGLAAIQEYVRSGGNYLGFCGGAGLALSSPGGLGLCPLRRAAFTERLQHFMSGHLHVRLNPAACPGLLPNGLGPTVDLPVWWPGRFESGGADNVRVPAEFAGPANDFCLADLPIASLPAGTFEVWKDLYGFSPTPSFLEGSPCMVAGDYGTGRYVLSYSHLETPASPDAGRIFAQVVAGHNSFQDGEAFVKSGGQKGPQIEILPPGVYRIHPGLFKVTKANAIVVENVFYLPGIGRLVFQAIGNRDLIVVQNVVMLLAALVIVVNFLVDVAQAWIDPRVRASAL